MYWSIPEAPKKKRVVVPPKDDLGSILKAFTTPHDATIPLPPTPIEIVSVFCPNANSQRHLTSFVVPEKVALFVERVSAFIKLLGAKVHHTTFYAFGPDLADYPDAIGVLHSNTLRKGEIQGGLEENWKAFSGVVERLQKEIPEQKIELRSAMDFLGVHLASAAQGVDAALVERLAGIFREQAPSYVAMDAEEVRVRVRANLILYRATVMAVAKKNAIILGVEVSRRYWDQLWPQLKEEKLAPPLFWLPGSVRQHFGFRT